MFASQSNSWQTSLVRLGFVVWNMGSPTLDDSYFPYWYWPFGGYTVYRIPHFQTHPDQKNLESDEFRTLADPWDGLGAPFSKSNTLAWAWFKFEWCNHGRRCMDDHIFLISDWWFGTWILFFHILAMSSSQLTHIFQRGRYTTNQILRSLTRY